MARELSANARAQLSADTQAVVNQSRLSRRISDALRGFGGAAAEGEGIDPTSLEGQRSPFARQLGREGALTGQAMAGLDREAAQREGAFSDPRTAALMGQPNLKGMQDVISGTLASTARGRRSELAKKKTETQREDLASIFGRNLQQQATISGITSGTLKEADPPRSGTEEALDIVNDAIGSIF